MSSSKIAQLSLFQLTQSLETPLPVLAMRLDSFQSLAKTWIGFLKNEKLKSEIWFKLPEEGHTIELISDFTRSGYSEKVYYCQLEEAMSLEPELSKPSLMAQKTRRFTSLFLSTSIHLQREHFLVIVGSRFCGVLLARQETNSVFGPVNVAYSLDPEVTESILQGIQQRIVITDTTPTEALNNHFTLESLPKLPEAELLDSLLRSQVVANEAERANQKTLNTSSTDLVSTVFFQNLVQEMSFLQTNMKTALRLLESMQGKREQRERYLEFVQRECNRQNSLVTALQELVEINGYESDFPPSRHLEDLIPAIVSTYQPLAKERDIILGYTLPPELPAVTCPDNWLQRILHHLLDNSLKFTPEKGQVQVTCQHKRDWLEISVRDNGVGIDLSDQPFIFNCFYRGRNNKDEEKNGVGLGLTAAMQMVERSGGTIKINSQPNKGTLITITLKVAE